MIVNLTVHMLKIKRNLAKKVINNKPIDVVISLCNSVLSIDQLTSLGFLD